MKRPNYLSVQVIPNSPEQSGLLFDRVAGTEKTRRHPFRIAQRVVDGSVICKLPTDDATFPLDERIDVLKDRAEGVGFLRHLDEGEGILASDAGLEIAGNDVDGLVDAR